MAALLLKKREAAIFRQLSGEARGLEVIQIMEFAEVSAQANSFPQ